MAEYKSKYSRLSFYVNGERKQFSQGRYSTEDKAEIEALDALTDAQKAEAKAEPAPKAQAQPEEKAEPKAAPKRKPAATSKSTKPKADKPSGK